MKKVYLVLGLTSNDLVATTFQGQQTMNQGMLITRVACAALAVLPLAAGQHACQTLGETFLKKCNTSSQSAGSSCPTGCMDAYKACVSNSGKKCTEWTEAVPGGMSNLMVESFGMTTFGWGGQTPNTTNATVENYVRFGTIVNRLADRCEWPGMHGTCEYHYILALETADEPPGDVHGYNCSTTKSRDVCSGECKSLLSKAEKYCKPGHSYSGRNGMTTSYQLQRYDGSATHAAVVRQLHLHAWPPWKQFLRVPLRTGQNRQHHGSQRSQHRL